MADNAGTPTGTISHMTRTVACLLCLSLVALSSCATVLAKDERTVMVTSNPPGAEIFVNGAAKGTTPTKIVVDDHEKLQVSIRKEGFHNGGCYINTSIVAKWVVADVLLMIPTLLLPVAPVIDLVTGDWASLDSAYCTVDLTPRSQVSN